MFTKDKFKILLLNYEFPPLGGGAGTATQSIAKEMAKLGHEVKVITTWFQGLAEREIIDGYIVVRVKSRRRKKEGSCVLEMISYVLEAIKYLSKEIKSDRPNRVVSFFAVPSGLVAWFLYKKYDIQYALSLRGGDVPGFLPKELYWHHLVTKPLTKIVWRNATHIFANSKGLQELAQKTAQPLGKEVLYVPNGVDTSLYKPNEVKGINKRKSTKIRIVTVGRLVKQKNIAKALKVMALVKNKLSDFNFTIIGDGPLKKELQKETDELKLREEVHFLGWLGKEELQKEYRQYDIFLLSSLEEGMPNVVLEAMASGLAVIATDITGSDELVVNGINGFLCKTSQEMADLIVTLSSNKAQLELLKKGSLSRVEMFSWGSVAKAYCLI